MAFYGIKTHHTGIIRKIKLLITLAIVIFSPVMAKAEDNKYALSLSPLLGVLYGQGEEIVYKYLSQDKFLSQLLWDQKPLLYAGVEAEFGPRSFYEKSGICASFSIKCGLPFKSGIIENRDWDDLYDDDLTHYSRHDAFSKNAILADLSIGYSWRITNRLALGANGAFSFMHFSWSGSDGYYQYAELISYRHYKPWDENIIKTEFKGPVINYTQNWFIVSPGVSLKLRINSLLSLDGNFFYSPLILSVNKDEHLLKELSYKDHTYFGHHLKAGASLVFSISERVGLLFNLSYKTIFGSRGDTEVERNNNKTRNYGNSGAGYSSLDLALSLKMSVLRF
jgi:outer membrane protease